jgi:CspA family cold shock protein
MGRKKFASAEWQLGTVHWFDEKSGEGLIKSNDGYNFYVHYSAIETKNKRRSLKEKQKVEFQIIDDTTFTQVTRVKEI